jgi:hypothetical protein
MKKILLNIVIVFFALNLQAQLQSDTTSAPATPENTALEAEPEPEPEAINAAEPQKQKKKSSFKMSKLFFGGSLGMTFGSFTSIRVNPLIGYSFTPKLSAGITGLYEYRTYDYLGQTKKSNDYGGSIFARFRVVQPIYLHAEYSYISYEFYDVNDKSYRQGVPFLFVGAGYVQRVGKNTYVYGQILFDVIQSDKSPYSQWEPFYSFGVSVGF